MSTVSKTIVSSTFLAAALLVAAAPVQAQDKEKCWGIAKTGTNDCAAADGSHTCATKAVKDNYAYDWKYTAKGTCSKEGGKTTPPPVKPA